ncbi:MAG: O-antigen ligase family protein [Ignavibacteriae bacterium]|nr:O-antigen ligase family protein [Ignavibacteriota bacterium]
MVSSIVSVFRPPFERITLLLAAVCLLMPGSGGVFLVISAAGLLIYYIARHRRRGVATTGGPVNPPLVLYSCVLLPLGCVTSPLEVETVCRSALVQWCCIAVFCVLAEPPAAHSRIDRNTTRTAMIAASGLAGVCGIFGVLMMKQAVKFSFLAPVLAQLQSAGAASDGFSPGHVALVTAVGVPMATLGALDMWRTGAWRQPVVGAGLMSLPFILVSVTLITQSRSALIATAVGLSVALWLGGREGRIVLGGLILTCMGLVFAVGPDSTLDAFIFAGKSTGFSAETVFTSRTELWTRALFAIRDFPLTGLGPDSFAAVIRLYPLSSGVALVTAHAHNQVLQLITEIGVLAPFLMGWIAIAVLRPLSRSRTGPSVDFLRAGILGSCVAFVAVSATEAIPAGSWMQLVPWVTLGLAARHGATHLESTNVTKRRHHRVLVMVVVSLLLADVILPRYSPLAGIFRANLHALRYARAVLSGTPPPLFEGPATGEWLRGLAYHHLKDPLRRDSSWHNVLATDSRYILLVRQAAPENRGLSDWALQTHPASARACFWAAALRAREDTAAAIRLYRRGLAVDANAALEWRALGDLLKDHDPRAAIWAYLESCRRGDPGANGCLLAGITAEKLGEYRDAVRYYRMSRWRGAHTLADSLERRMAQR